MDENFGGAYLDECEDWRARYQDAREEENNESTADIQYDLAMLMADGITGVLADTYQKILKMRQAKLPTNCRFVYDRYARFNRRLKFDLE